MAKVTSKLQLTVPKSIADQYKIRPGDELDWLPAGDAIRVIKRGGSPASNTPTPEERLRLFDEATARQNKRNSAFRKKHATEVKKVNDRGWKREDLYDRGVSR
ncbi:MAG TPA: AbrB/MazE/SpoVT family DNA-binding domain-containing protein [Terriglobales bacterium]|nr:AbrB/MazE/SpoVT family DNA-binding domain-containing protein [Terriglobales bacterium]